MKRPVFLFLQICNTNEGYPRKRTCRRALCRQNLKSLPLKLTEIQPAIEITISSVLSSSSSPAISRHTRNFTRFCWWYLPPLYTYCDPLLSTSTKTWPCKRRAITAFQTGSHLGPRPLNFNTAVHQLELQAQQELQRSVWCSLPDYQWCWYQGSVLGVLCVCLPSVFQRKVKLQCTYVSS